jgi:hypothetical protein
MKKKEDIQAFINDLNKLVSDAKSNGLPPSLYGKQLAQIEVLQWVLAPTS